MYINHPIIQMLNEHLGAQIQSPSDLLRDKPDRSNFDEVFLYELFRKADDLPLGIDTKRVTLDLFWSTEKRVAAFNKVYRDLDSDISDRTLPKLWRRWKFNIEKLVGHAGPNFDSFAPVITTGATIHHRRGALLASHLQYYNTRSARLEEWLARNGSLENDPWFRTTEVSQLHDGTAVAGVVRKTAKSDRLILKSTRQVVSYQCAIGVDLKKRLYRHGINLSTAPEWHKATARVSSKIQHIATVDFENASNTIPRAALLLFPPAWREALDATRDTHVLIEHPEHPNSSAMKHELQMLAGNGCGWTFEVESILFYCLAISIAQMIGELPLNVTSKPYLYSIVGDDLIIPNELFGRITKGFEALGFIINKDKSFHDGLFRESCGGDFYNFRNMRGYNAKRLPTTDIELTKFINGIREVCYTNNNNVWRSHAYLAMWNRIVALVKDPIFGPSYLGDVVIHTSDESRWSVKTNKWGKSTIVVYHEKYREEDLTTFNRLLKRESHLTLEAQLLCAVHPSSKGLGDEPYINMLKHETAEERTTRLHSNVNKRVPLPGATPITIKRRIPFAYQPLPFEEGDVQSLWTWLKGQGHVNCRIPDVVTTRFERRQRYKHSVRLDLIDVLRRYATLMTDFEATVEKQVSSAEVTTDYDLEF